MFAFNKISATFVVSLLISSVGATAFAATGNTTTTGAVTPAIAGSVVKFDVIAPTTAKADEAIDITVRAVDKNGNPVTSYRGSIYFNSNDIKAILPFVARGYTFSATDNGVAVFSKGVTFKSQGDFDIIVQDMNEDIDGKARVKVSGRVEAPTASGSESISILTPENNATLTSETITISGKTRKNSRVILDLNSKEAGNTISTEDGSFVITLKDLTQATNIIQARVIDASNNVIGRSSPVTFTLDNNTPKFYGATMMNASGNLITPDQSLYTGDSLSITVEADQGLSEVSIGLDGSVIPLKENAPGKYSGTLPAPGKALDYPLSAILKNQLGKTTTQNNIATIRVIDRPVAPVVLPSFKDIQTTSGSGKATFVFSLSGSVTDLAKFRIDYGTTVGQYTESKTTFDATKILSGTTYSWYIPNLEPKMYYFKLNGIKADGSLIPGLTSNEITLNMSPVQCSIANVGNVRVETFKDKSVLSWDTVSNAISYNIYKKDANSQFVLFQNTKETKHTIFLEPGKVVYDDFAIKALCDDKTTSAEYTNVSKVQTGPGFIGFLVVLASLIGVILMRRRTVNL